MARFSPWRRMMLAWLAGAALGCQKPGGRSSSPASSDAVTLELNWFPEAEHGGYYAALVHGDYAAEDLRLNIAPGGPGVPVLQDVAAGKADFGVTNADQILFAREAGADIVAVFAPLQNSPRCIMVHADSGIEAFEQLRDLTLAVGSSSAFFRFVARRVPLDQVEIVAYTGSIAPFLENPRYAQQAYVFSEPLLAAERGATPRCLMVSELGFNPYTSVLFTRRELAERQPDRVARVVRAAVRGWKHYLEDPAATNVHLLDVNPEMSPSVLQKGARELARLCLPDGMPADQLGLMTAARWQQLLDQMIETDLLAPGRVAVDAVFTTRFLPASTPA